jgi:MarR family transcriptional regulator, lower aerobic nicotinate degradation pathway regulator
MRLPSDLAVIDDLGTLIPRARHKIRRYAAIRLDVLGESILNWPLLRRLMDHGGLSQQELAHLTAQHPAAVSRSLYDLEERRLVRRTRDPHDRRRVLVTLTPRGLKHCRVLHPEILLAVARVLEPLSAAERLLLRDLLRKIVGGVEDELRGPPAP